FYTKLRPLYVPLMTRSAILPVGERLLRFGLSRNMKKGPFIFLACMPKSGSTFITQLMHESTGFPMRGVMSSGENPDLDGTMIRALAGLGTVTQTHFICTAQYV